jgi:hypothetical protein
MESTGMSDRTGDAQSSRSASHGPRNPTPNAAITFGIAGSVLITLLTSGILFFCASSNRSRPRTAPAIAASLISFATISPALSSV